MSSAGDLQRPYLIAGLLVALYCLLYLVSLGVRPLFIPDEVRYGEIAREMIANGNWIVPRLNGLLYFEKPPLGYWLNAISLMIFGDNPFAVRFSGAFSVAFSSLTVFLLGRRFLGSSLVACFAILVFLSTFAVQAVGTFSVLDSGFAAVLNAGIALFAIGTMFSGKKRSLYLAASGILFGMAFLIKGFLALALPVLILMPWLLINRNLDLLFRRAWISVIFAAAIIAPWSLAINVEQPDFWRYFFWVEHIQRFAGDNAQHREPFYFYLIFLPVVAFPWIMLLPASVAGLRRRDRRSERQGAVSLLALWTVVPLVFFSIASGKLVTYILPCFAPFSLLVAAGLRASAARAPLLRGGLAAVGLVLCGALVALVITQLRQGGTPTFEADESFKYLLLAGALLLGIAAVCHGWVSSDQKKQGISGGLAMIPVLVALPWTMPNEVLRLKAPVAFIQDVYSQVPAAPAVAANGSLIRAVCWSLKRDDVSVIENGGELTYGLNVAGGEERFLSDEGLSNLLQQDKDVLLFCKGECSMQTLDRLPAETRTWSYGNFNAYFVQGKPDLPVNPDT